MPVFYSLADVCAVAMTTSINIKQAFKIDFVYLQKNLVVRFSLQFAYSKHLTEDNFIIPCWRFTEISKISSVKVQLLFNTPVTYCERIFVANFVRS